MSLLFSHVDKKKEQSFYHTMKYIFRESKSLPVPASIIHSTANTTEVRSLLFIYVYAVRRRLRNERVTRLNVSELQQ